MRPSLADFDEIFQRGLLFGKPVSEQVERDIRARCATLATFPEVGPSTDLKDNRRLPMARYPFTVFYRIDRDNNRIEGLRIVHGSLIRDLG